MNNQTIIIRVSFAKGSNEIYCGYTDKGNVTLVGQIQYSTNLNVSYTNTIVKLSSPDMINSVGIICMPNEELAGKVIDELNSIQTKRPINVRGNKFPFCWLKIQANSDIIFNKGENGEPNRLSFLDIENVEVSSDIPSEVLDQDLNPKREVTVRSNNTKSFYERRKERQQPLQKMSKLSNNHNSQNRKDRLTKNIPF